MKWFKRQWNTNSNFRHAVGVLLSVALTSAGVPVALSAAASEVLTAVHTIVGG